MSPLKEPCPAPLLFVDRDLNGLYNFERSRGPLAKGYQAVPTGLDLVRNLKLDGCSCLVGNRHLEVVGVVR